MIEDRVRLFMSELTDPRRRYKQLEEWTGIAADRWSAVWLKRQRPTVEMLEELCHHEPELIMWLTTGRTHRESGQISLEEAAAKKRVNWQDLLTKVGAGMELTEDEKLVKKCSDAYKLGDRSHLLPSFERKAARKKNDQKE
ncbi:MAG: hypothetical protein EPO09_07185 [Aquabacterium sp.]|uniref:hypothetical protein n=1 Tax=Aquabacterium sp. TaxID=1872578 RepID=UPI001202D23A|nr:hypothetical protein [Aquabacterium sp.]TAK95908.1 MAG: hypothetical protein EPO09_07185 [Aquabacterium sp.]